MIKTDANQGSMPHPSTSLLLLLGYRKAAIRAAKNLGYEVGLVHHNDLPLKVKNELSFFEMVDFRQDPFVLAQNILLHLQHHEGLQGKKICGVLALTEKTVVVAAHIRKATNLPGLLPEAAILGHDKWFMKKKACSAGIPMTPYHLIKNDNHEDELSSLIKSWGLPIVIKERSLSGGRSMKICHDEDSLKLAAKENLLAEKFIEGTELSVEAFVCSGKVVFRNFTQYYIPWSVNILPAVLDEKISREIIQIHEKILELFQIERGMTHMEFYLTQSGPLFGELAIRPPGGYIMELIEHAYGIKAWEALIRNEVGESEIFPSIAKTIAASWVIHPGAGLVERVEGVDKISHIPEVKQIKLKLNPGEKVETRAGAGDDRGSIIFAGNDYQELVSAIEEARSLLKIHWDQEK